MNWIPDLFRRRKLYDDLSEEIHLHIEERAEQFMRDGMSREEAERQARLSFGNTTLLEERSREVWQWQALESIWGDVLFAMRQLRRSPGFTVTAVITLALAIGANAVVFSVLNAFIIRPLNVANPQSLYGLWRTDVNNMAESYPDYLDLRDRNHSFDDLIAYNAVEAGMEAGETPTRVWGEEVSGNYFDSLRISPYLGRVIHASDEHGANSAPWVVLSYAYWHTHFQDDRRVVGRIVRLNKHPFTVIGVAPAGFNGTLLFFQPDFFVPIVDHSVFGTDDLTDRGDRWVFMTLGHLKPGVSKAQAIGDLNAISAQLAQTYPKQEAKTAFSLARPSLYGDYVGGPVREFLGGLLLLSALILLAACANLGSLFAARAADRSREVALRLALGSTRRRILRALFTEAVMISIAGGALGLAGSVLLLQGLSDWRPIARWPLQLNVTPDATVYGVALLIALASGFLFGAVPVRQVLRTNAYEVIKAGSTRGSRRRITARDMLLVVQIAICAVLVTSSMVAVRGLSRSLRNHLGFAVGNTMLVDTDLSMAGYRGDRVESMQKRMIEAVASIPGVDSVAMADTVPLGVGGTGTHIFPESATDLRPANASAHADIFRVTPEYFRAAGTALLAGRTLTPGDDKNAPRVAIVNELFARRMFGSAAKAIGGRFKTQDGALIRVVGVAEDGKYGSLTEDPQWAVFIPLLQSPGTATSMVIRSSRDPLQLAQAIRIKLRQLDSGLPAFIQTRLTSLGTFLFGPRMATIALGLLGLMGVVLSITGIFGMAAYTVSKRLRELGIRIALGAQRRELLQAALGRAVKLLAFGSAAGLVLGFMASRVLAFVVYQATPRDPLVLAGVVVAMALLGVVATWIPAQRALRIDPLILLRED